MNTLDALKRSDFVIVGFPKSGTTALIKRLEREPGLHIGKLRHNNYEAPIAKPGEAPDSFIEPSKINGHKYAAYIYDDVAIDRIAQSGALIIVCIREPIQALISWWNMHRRHAEMNIGMPSKSEEKREFFRTCSLGDYWNRFANTRMDYIARLDYLESVAPADRVLFIRQEDMAANMGRILSNLGERLGFQPTSLPSDGAAHPLSQHSTSNVPENVAARLGRQAEQISSRGITPLPSQ
mgnify:CR=1 FL=1